MPEIWRKYTQRKTSVIRLRFLVESEFLLILFIYLFIYVFRTTTQINNFLNKDNL